MSMIVPLSFCPNKKLSKIGSESKHQIYFKVNYNEIPITVKGFETTMFVGNKFVCQEVYRIATVFSKTILDLNCLGTVLHKKAGIYFLWSYHEFPSFVGMANVKLHVAGKYSLQEGSLRGLTNC